MSVAEFYDKYPSIIVQTQSDVYKLEATDFERLCQAWCMESFPLAEISRGPTNRGDQGVDIDVVVGGITPMRLVIQAKCWDPQGPNISIKVVNETVGAAVAKNAGYAIVITSTGFTAEAKAQAKRSTEDGKINMNLMDGNVFWDSLMQLPEYSKRRSAMLQSNSLDPISDAVVPSTHIKFTNQRGYTFASKIEQKIMSDTKLHDWLVLNQIACFQDFLFLSQDMYTKLHRFSLNLSTGTKLALKVFLEEEINHLCEMFRVRVQNIKEQVKTAKNLDEVFNILELEPAVRTLFVSSHGVGQNFDEKDSPQVLCAIENEDFERLLYHIQSATCRHELIAVMNVITGKSEEELEGSVLNMTATDSIYEKLEIVDASNGKIKKLLIGPGMFSLPIPLTISSNIDIIGSGCGVTVVSGTLVVKTTNCKLANFTISNTCENECIIVMSEGSSSMIASNIEFGFQRQPHDGLSPKNESLESLVKSQSQSQSQSQLQSQSLSSSQHGQQPFQNQFLQSSAKSSVSSYPHQILESSVAFANPSSVSSGIKRKASDTPPAVLNIGDIVTFRFKLWASESSGDALEQGEIIDILDDVQMNQIGWLTDGQLDTNYIPSWYPNCDLSLTTVPSDSEDESDDEDFSPNGTSTTLSNIPTEVINYSPVHSHVVLSKYTCISVAYGYMEKEEIIEKVPIQENGVVTAVDLNKEKRLWCKICFFRENENQFWYSWQRVENVQFPGKKQRFN